MREVIVRLKKRNKSIKEIRKPLGRPQKTTKADYCKPYSQYPDRSRIIWRRQTYHCQGLQSRDAYSNVNIDSVYQGAKHWLHSRTGKQEQTLSKNVSKVLESGGEVWRRNGTACDSKQTTSCDQHCGGSFIMAARGTGALVSEVAA